MPPKQKQAGKKNNNDFQTYKVKDLDREFFEIQFSAKENIIKRL